MFKSDFTHYFISALILLFTSCQVFSQADKVAADIANVMKQFDVVGLSVVVVKTIILFIQTHSV